MCICSFSQTEYTHILYLYITYYFTSELNIQTWMCQPTVGGLGWCFGFLGSPYERDCYLGVPLESQATNPNHQFRLG